MNYGLCRQRQSIIWHMHSLSTILGSLRQNKTLSTLCKHGRLKLENSCWQTSKSWQTRAFTRQTRVKSQHTVTCNMADVLQWHSRRVTACILVLLYVNRRRRNRKRWKKKRLGRNPRISVGIPPLEFITRLFWGSLYAAGETSHRSGQFWTSSINWKVDSRSSRSSAIFFKVSLKSHE